MMSDELREAAERLTTGEGYPEGIARAIFVMNDGVRLAEAYLVELARRDQEHAEHSDEASHNPAVVAELVQREREAAERALPVTEEWLQEIGADDYVGLPFLGAENDGEQNYVMFCSDGVGIIECRSETDTVDLVMLGVYPTRGHVLDLLSALGAGKGGA